MCVVTSFVLEEIIGNRLAMARIAKWALELMGLDIAYVPPNNDQVLGPGRLCGQVDRDSAAPPPRSLKSIGACISMAPLPLMESGEV
jgi:hypothetical protein